MGHQSWIESIAIVCAVGAAAIQIYYLVARPCTTHTVRIAMLFGLGVLPIITAGATNISGFKATKSRVFCGSCHVMAPHAHDSENRESKSLAAVHGRNESFGADNCYTCHADYGMYGFVVTKMGGMGHVYQYLTKYHAVSNEEFAREVRIKKPIANKACMTCHSTEAPSWLKVGDHASALAAVRTNAISCASPGCHGYAHPFSKTPEELGKAAR